MLDLLVNRDLIQKQMREQFAPAAPARARRADGGRRHGSVAARSLRALAAALSATRWRGSRRASHAA